jgi:ActR/RegA family two-component response regulator
VSVSTDTDDRFLSLDEINIQHIRKALTLADGKISGPGGAAKLLEIHPNTLRKRMEKLNIPYKRTTRRNP